MFHSLCTAITGFKYYLLYSIKILGFVKQFDTQSKILKFYISLRSRVINTILMGVQLEKREKRILIRDATIGLI